MSARSASRPPVERRLPAAAFFQRHATLISWIAFVPIYAFALILAFG